VDPRELEKLREASGLRLDADGRFWHRGEPVEHARTVAVLHRGLHRAPNGKWATRIGSEWGYVDVDDAARFVRRIQPDGARVRAQLTNGTWVEVDPETIASGAGDALYLRLPDGERARLTRAAQLSLADHLREDGGGFALDLGGRLVRIGRDSGPERVRRTS
jgi:uncharacterized protein